MMRWDMDIIQYTRRCFLHDVRKDCDLPGQVNIGICLHTGLAADIAMCRDAITIIKYDPTRRGITGAFVKLAEFGQV